MLEVRLIVNFHTQKTQNRCDTFWDCEVGKKIFWSEKKEVFQNLSVKMKPSIEVNSELFELA